MKTIPRRARAARLVSAAACAAACSAVLLACPGASVGAQSTPPTTVAPPSAPPAPSIPRPASAFVPPELPETLGTPDWESLFGAPGLGNASYVFGGAHCAAVWDDGLGDGPVLYVGGNFESAGGVDAYHLARWDGTEWSGVGEGLAGWPYAMQVWEGELWMGGQFTEADGVDVDNLVKFDGTTFTDVGGTNGTVYALGLAPYPGGSNLVVGGDFTSIGGSIGPAVAAQHIAQWTGTAWTAMGAGFNDQVHAIQTYGPLIHVGGRFTMSGATPVSRLARWFGGGWQEAYGGVDGEVSALGTHFNGTVVELLVGGWFHTVGGGAVVSPRMAAWDGTAWNAMGFDGGGNVRDIASWDDGGGLAVHVCGNNLHVDGLGSLQMARWTGTAWEPVGGDLWSTGEFLEVFDDGSGESLWVGGQFPEAGGVSVGSVARWDGSAFHATATGLNGGWVEDLLVSTFGGGPPTLYMGGFFWGPGPGERRHLAAWQDGGFTDFGDADATVWALAEFNDGGGPRIYAGGDFTAIDGVPAAWIAKWDGAGWSPLGSDLDGRVRDLLTWNDGTGAKLYAAGQFTTAGGSPAPGVAVWDGSSWSPLGAGLTGAVHALETYDDGGGVALYACGDFGASTGEVHEKIAKWNGTSWESVGAGLDVLGFAHDMEVFDSGSGPRLHVGGSFFSAGGVPDTDKLAAWDGTAWHPVADLSNAVEALEVYDDGSGAALYAGGAFNVVDGSIVGYVARWDGSTWSALDAGVGHIVKALTIFDDGSGAGPSLAVGGSFTHANGVTANGHSHVVLWGGCWDGIDNWTDLGFALPGTFGDPLLVGTGSLALGSYNLLDLSNALPSVTAALFISFTSTPVPFAGGTLVPNPSLSPIFVTTSPLGTLPLPFLMPEGVPPGFQFFFQWAVDDPGAVSGIALSNAVRGDVP